MMDLVKMWMAKMRLINLTSYKHGVICPLIEPSLLRSVRSEIQEHLSFTEKETDIYKIFQSGDLANLDGLDDASLARLPSLLQLRDALYSQQFREYLSSLTGSGKLSGQKTDMAINVYTEGCHLLCHDDVIGSRRLSYILYLTDPDTPWRPEWGGALRLYPTTLVAHTDPDHIKAAVEIKIPSPDHSISIPPAFNQLSFFTVQPGESFHDVEEVYRPSETDKGKEKKRVRMAISGWYHIPQEGEDGYEEGLEEKLAERSSLSQLQGRGNIDIYDQPQPSPITVGLTPSSPRPPTYDEDMAWKGKGKNPVKVSTIRDEGAEATVAAELSEFDLDFLLKFIAPSYLTPDIADELAETFETECSLSLDQVLSEKFASELRKYIEEQEADALPPSSSDIELQTQWTVARPPHKHRYLFEQPGACKMSHLPKSPISELLNDLLPSLSFKKWLSKITGLNQLTKFNLLARRFRRGKDYTLANEYRGEEPQLEFTIGLTPTLGWEKDEQGVEDYEDEGEEEEEGEEGEERNGGAGNGDGLSGSEQVISKEKGTGEPVLGGYEVYMRGDDEDGDDEYEDYEKEEEEISDGEQEPGNEKERAKAKKPKSDPAIYKSASGADGEDDGVLFSMAAGWNRMSIVLRDRGVLKFVKYVSAAALGDRWDITGEVGVLTDDDDDE
jgi:prolyl 3-hydroxylase /prolyl 3,4-dihydroxylase